MTKDLSIEKVLITPVMEEIYDETLKKLRNLKSFPGLKFKPFKGSMVNDKQVFYLRDDNKIRLYCIFEDEHTLNFLNADTKHKPERFFFYNKNITVDEGKLRNRKKIIQFHQDSCFSIDDASISTVVRKSNRSVIYFQEELICLDDQQEQVFINAVWPLVISGPPGSGKSCVEIGLLESWVTAARDTFLLTRLPMTPQSSSSVSSSADTLTVTHFAMPQFAYVAESAKLRTHMAQIWQTQPDLADVTESVRFSCYEDILKYADSATENKCFLTRTESRARFLETPLIKTLLRALAPASIRGNKGKGRVADSTKKLATIFAEKLYQEFLMMAGYVYDENDVPSFDIYKELGPWTSRFSEETLENKTKIFKTFCAYQQGLIVDKAHIVDPFLYRPKAPLPPLFAGMAVDEAQDYVPVQTFVLNQLAENKRVAYGVDTHQNVGVAAQNSIRVYLEHILGASHITLDYPHRYPNLVMDVLSVALGLKLKVMGGLADKHDYAAISRSDDARATCAMGHVSYTAGLPTGEALAELKARIQGRASVAIITRPELVQPLQKLLGHPLVFSPEQIKGLEFETIILWDVLSDPQYYAVNKILSAQASSQSHLHRAKDKMADVDIESVAAMAAFLTALSRSTDTLHIYQKDDPHRLGHITKPLKEKIAEFTADKVNVSNATVSAPSTPAEWESMVTELIKNESMAQAQAIWTGQLKRDLKNFESHRRRILGLPEPVAPISASRPSRVGQSSQSQRGPKKAHAGRAQANTPHNNTPKCSTSKEMAAFFDAIRYKDEKKARSFLQKFGPNAILSDGPLPILLIALGEEIHDKLGEQAETVIKYLLDHGADIHATTSNGLTALQIAVMRQDTKVIALLLARGVKIDSQAYDMGTALIKAVSINNTNIVKILLNAGANPDIIYDGIIADSAIELAAVKGHLDILTLLIQKKAAIGKALKIAKGECRALLQIYANNLLLDAIRANDFHKVQWLIEAGAEANADADAKGNALAFTIYATTIGNLAIVELLLKSGADPNKQASEGVTALHSIFLEKDRHTREHRCQLVKLLLTYHADPNLQTSDECTVLQRVISVGDYESVKLLLAAGADVNVSDVDGYTPLLSVAHEIHNLENKLQRAPTLQECENYLSMATALLAKGANPNVYRSTGDVKLTPLIIAVQCNNQALLKLLLDNHADVNMFDTDGRSALYHAVFLEKTECAALLLAHGAEFMSIDSNGTSIYTLAWAQFVDNNKHSIAAYSVLSRNNADPHDLVFCQQPNLVFFETYRSQSPILQLIYDHMVEQDKLMTNVADLLAEPGSIKAAVDSALGIAIAKHDQEMVEHLLVSGADKRLAIIIAGAYGYWDIFYHLLNWRNPPANSTQNLVFAKTGFFADSSAGFADTSISESHGAIVPVSLEPSTSVRDNSI